MTTFSKLYKVTAVCTGTVIFGGLLYYNFEKVPYSDFFAKSENINNKYLSKWDHNWDRRDPKSTTKPSKDNDDYKKHPKKGKASRHIILIRHGQYNTKGKVDNERYLTNLGKVQAEATGLRLAELGFPYTAIIRSTMTRARETSQLIQTYLPGVPVTDDSLLVEGYPIAPDPPSGYWTPEKAFYQDNPRIEAAFRKYIHRAEGSDEKDTYTIIVCHANVIRYFVCRALQLPPNAWLRMSLNHGSITWITVLPSGRVILRALGETGHMMPQWITSH